MEPGMVHYIIYLSMGGSSVPNQISIKERIYDLIMDDILSLEYKPNDILNEKILVEKYGCSKTPVREALLSLCDEGVLRSIPRYGYEVVRITTDDIREMLQYRFILESGLLSRSLDSFGGRQLDRLSEINDKCTEFDKDVWEHWRYNTSFHMKMISYCGNSYAMDALGKTMDRLKRAYAQLYWNHLDKSSLSMDTRYHKDLIQCLRSRDTDKLLVYLQKDLNDFGGANFSFDLKLKSEK